MKKLKIATFLLASCMSSSLLSEAQDLVVVYVDGTQTQIALSSKPRISFEEAVMKVSGENLDLVIPMGDVKNYRFATESKVQDIENGLTGLDGDHMIDMNGHIVPLNWNRPGVYVVKVNGKYVKCIKK